MKRIELVNLLNSLDLKREDYIVVGVSSLVLRGIIEECFELDMFVNLNAFATLRRRFTLFPKSSGWFTVTIAVEILPKSNFGKFELYDDYQIEDLNTIYNFYKKRNLPKDQKIIAKIERYL